MATGMNRQAQARVWSGVVWAGTALLIAMGQGCTVPSTNVGVDAIGADGSQDIGVEDMAFDWGNPDPDVVPDFKRHDDLLDEDPVADLVDATQPDVLPDGIDELDTDEGDGELAEVDDDADVEPGDAMDVEVVTQEEVCNGVDDDNDGEIDEGLLLVFQADADLDGYGDPYNVVKVCAFGPGVSANKSDCDDTDPNSYPGATEVCDDNDNDCDGAVDEDLGVTVCGLGPCSHLEVNCQNGVWKECDPMKGSQAEVCDGTDNDCDGTADDGVLRSFFEDKDADGFGNAAKQVWACQPPAGTVANSEDCDDTRNTVWPGAAEVCDGLDNDCDGASDEQIPDLECGLGECVHSEPACADGVPRTCDPLLGALDEVCDGLDNDCDGEPDNGVLTTWYKDEDGDGYGLLDQWQLACEAPDGYVEMEGDCDDVRSDAWPGADEVCNGLDEDCDQEVDEELPDLSCGLGNCAHVVVACVEGVPQSCDPMEGASVETCDGEDDDCDGAVDQGFGSTVCGQGLCMRELPNCQDGKLTTCDPLMGAELETCDLQDNDCDGQVDEELGQTKCGLGLCEHTVENCIDGVPQPCDPFAGAAAEVCDGFDNDCNGADDDALPDLECGLGDCMHTVPSCVFGFPIVCDPWEGASPEMCDGFDNDCDGLLDEDMPTLSCGQGVCAHQVPSCLEGVPQQCDPNQGAQPESCDGLDNDCDGAIDNGVMPTWYRDEDADTFGDPTRPFQQCTQPEGYVANNLDCNDLTLAIKPGATETCDGKDQDCDGLIDEGVLKNYYLDEDGDGYGALSKPVQACTLPAGASALSNDCDDSDKFSKPGGVEVCDGKDQDCDGTPDDGVLVTFYRDADGDGYGVAAPTTQACTAPQGYVFNKNDCNDNSNISFPGATEVCDGIDNDCDGSIDEGVKITFYQDADSDGYGVPTATILACTKPAGYATISGDCNDTRNDIRPGAAEVCDGVDNDCDSAIDEGVKTLYYRDVDGDGYGVFSPTLQACEQPTGYTTNYDDCNDNSAVSYPNAPEICDSADNDCDGQIDEGVRLDFFRDSDSDGFGDPAVKTKACVQPTGYVSDNTDCNDNRSNAFPGAEEVCDYIDNDCDTLVDEGVLITYYRDSDLDGFGNPNNTTQGCSAITGYITTAGDCDDGKAGVNPLATEVCDGLDNDCEGGIDEGVIQTFYRDADYDGYGVDTTTLQGCSKPTGYALVPGDCNDAIGAIKPGAAEACDMVDNDCDQIVDEDWGLDITNVSCGTITIRNMGMYPLTSFGVLIDGNVVSWSGIDTLPAGESGTMFVGTSLDGVLLIQVLAECSADQLESNLSCP